MADSSYPWATRQTVSATGSDSDAAGNLGRYQVIDGITYKFVKAAAAIADAAKKILVYTDTAATTVNTTTTASNPKVAGVVPSDVATISSTSGTLDAADGFFIQTDGVATVISAAAVADEAEIGTSTTAGKVDDATIADGGVAGVALEAATGADEDLTVLLRGLR